MSCEACIKAEEIQKLVLEIAQLKEKVKASEEREKARDLKYENLYEKQNQQLTTQALMSQQIDNIEKTLNKFIEGEFKEFVKEFKELSDKPKKRWDLVITGFLSAAASIIAKTVIDKLIS